MRLVWTALLILFSLPQTSWAQKILVLSDIHNNQFALEQLAAASPPMEVDHVVLLGDLSRRADLENLTSLISFIKEKLQLSHFQVSFFPGNRDIPTASTLPNDWATRIQEHAQVITPHTDQYGYLEINGFRIAAAHFPLRPVPEELLPPPFQRINYRSWITGEPSTNSTMENPQRPNRPVDLILFGHTHIPGLYRDPELLVPVLNPGALIGRQLHTYSIIDVQKREVSFFQLNDNNRELLKISLHNVQKYGNCINALTRIILRVPSLN